MDAELVSELIELFKQEKAVHTEELHELWEAVENILKHHDDMSASIHKMVGDSERRIDRTNEMVSELSQTITKVSQQNEMLTSSYMGQLESARQQIEYLQAENKRLRDENMAYYNALCQERDRNNSIMQAMVQQIMGAKPATSPLVTIDQKQI